MNTGDPKTYSRSVFEAILAGLGTGDTLRAKYVLDDQGARVGKDYWVDDLACGRRQLSWPVGGGEVLVSIVELDDAVGGLLSGFAGEPSEPCLNQSDLAPEKRTPC